MDLVTHVLTGILVSKSSTVVLSKPLVLIGCVLPDIGEVLIQRRLAEKFGAKLAVYDDRTSDPAIASELSVTYLYDFFHSPIVALSMIGLGIWLGKDLFPTAGNLILSLGVGVLSHVLLDSFTHGKVWALKLLFPFSNKRFPILAEKVGNWWDWAPTVHLPMVEFSFPILCVLIWAILGTTIFFIK